jgi:hypothetical protein
MYFKNRNSIGVKSPISEYQDYWDKWHKQWFDKCSPNQPLLDSINEWITPTDRGGNDNPIWHYFPEPYWGNPNSEKLFGIFLNINPGGGGASQDILLRDQDESNPFNLYKNNNYSYSKTILKLSNITDYKTTEWIQKWRVNWLREVLDNKLITVSNIFCAELIPWHTKKKSDIYDYAIKTGIPELINNSVIIPLSKVSNSNSIINEMKGKVIVRSSLILDILNSIHSIMPNSIEIRNIENYAIVDNLPNKSNKQKLLSKFNSYLTIFKIEETSFYVFSGGSNSALPNPNFKVLPIGQNNTKRKTDISLKEFMKF